MLKYWRVANMQLSPIFISFNQQRADYSIKNRTYLHFHLFIYRELQTAKSPIKQQKNGK